MKRISKIRWLAVALIFAVIGTVAFFVFHHPPMRLMPPPLLVLSDEGYDAHTKSALVGGARSNLFYATNRYPIGTTQNRIYTVAPDTSLHVGSAELEIDVEGSTVDQLIDWTMNSGGSDRPYVRLNQMSEYGTLLPNGSGEVERWWRELNQALERIDNRSILVYVHGANTTVERAAGQASQLSHFSAGNAVIVLFAWPTAENFLKYPSDIRNALESAPKLAELINAISENTSAQRINVFSYSAGATVASQSLSLIAKHEPDILSDVGDIYFAAPDVDFTVFVDDLEHYKSAVHRVTAAVNLGDSALRLAKLVNRASRAGRPDLEELSPEASETLLDAARVHDLEVVHADPDILPSTSSTSHSFWYDDPWVSSDVLGSLLFRLTPVQRGLKLEVTESGGPYWYFPENYPDHISKLRASLANKYGN